MSASSSSSSKLCLKLLTQLRLRLRPGCWPGILSCGHQHRECTKKRESKGEPKERKRTKKPENVFVYLSWPTKRRKSLSSQITRLSRATRQQQQRQQLPITTTTNNNKNANHSWWLKYTVRNTQHNKSTEKQKPKNPKEKTKSPEASSVLLNSLLRDLREQNGTMYI